MLSLSDGPALNFWPEIISLTKLRLPKSYFLSESPNCLHRLSASDLVSLRLLTVVSLSPDLLSQSTVTFNHVLETYTGLPDIPVKPALGMTRLTDR